MQQSDQKNGDKYDLEERTYSFAENVRLFLRKVPKVQSNYEDGKQLIRSSGSVGANYIEANESLGKKDFLMKAKISRKESKESRFWLRLIDVGGSAELDKERQNLMQEAQELMLIFGAIIRNAQK